MDERFSRTALMLGDTALDILAHSRVAVFGLGGVGGYTVEALARGGVGTLHLVDNDTVSVSNINRQILATDHTVGQYKTDVAARRVASINPRATAVCHRTFFLPETADAFDFTAFDYVVDAIDTVSGKIALAQCAHAAGTPIISAMGAGNKLDATAFRVADIYKTTGCPLARVMRQELRKRGIPHLKTVYSPEPPHIRTSGERVPASVSFVPPVMGLILAGEVIKDLLAAHGEASL